MAEKRLDLIQKANRLFLDEKYEEAALSYQKLIKMDGGSNQSLFTLNLNLCQSRLKDNGAFLNDIQSLKDLSETVTIGKLTTEEQLAAQLNSTQQLLERYYKGYREYVHGHEG